MQLCCTLYAGMEQAIHSPCSRALQEELVIHVLMNVYVVLYRCGASHPQRAAAVVRIPARVGAAAWE